MVLLLLRLSFDDDDRIIIMYVENCSETLTVYMEVGFGCRLGASVRCRAESSDVVRNGLVFFGTFLACPTLTLHCTYNLMNTQNVFDDVKRRKSKKGGGRATEEKQAKK